jgi:hypothetical protein
MKIKVLECPLWVQHKFIEGYSSDALVWNCDEIEPMFHRDGYYLIDNKYVVIEYNNRAWRCKDDESSKRAFCWELEDAEYDDINMLSKEQSDAILTLMKIGLASEKQRHMFGRHLSQKSSKKFGLELKQRWKKLK